MASSNSANSPFWQPGVLYSEVVSGKEVPRLKTVLKKDDRAVYSQLNSISKSSTVRSANTTFARGTKSFYLTTALSKRDICSARKVKAKTSNLIGGLSYASALRGYRRGQVQSVCFVDVTPRIKAKEVNKKSKTIKPSFTKTRDTQFKNVTAAISHIKGSEKYLDTSKKEMFPTFIESDQYLNYHGNRITSIYALQQDPVDEDEVLKFSDPASQPPFTVYPIAQFNDGNYKVMEQHSVLALSYAILDNIYHVEKIVL